MLPALFTTTMAAALCISAFCTLHAQVQDSFSDGDLHYNPAWAGDTAHFRVNSAYNLQLQGNGTDTSYISTTCLLNANDSIQWDIWIRLRFAGSDNNFIRWYLWSSSANLESPLNGYYIRIGENGNNDCLRLYRQNGQQHSLLSSGPAGSLAASDNSVRIRVIRSPAGQFRIYADLNGNFVYSLQSTVTDSSFGPLPYTGIFCRYTAGNSNRFYIDDIGQQVFQPDTEKPRIQHIESGPAGRIRLRMSEALEQNSCSNLQHYLLNNNTLPDSVKADAARQELELFFNTQWAQESTHSLHVWGLTDLAGNSMHDSTLHFLFAMPEPFCLVINEILADPDPAIGLPACEYIELYNRKNYPLNLAAFRLQTGSNSRQLPALWVPPKAYVLIFDQAWTPYFPGLLTAPVSSFPAINNAGVRLALSDTGGQLIHEVHFSSSWYQDPVKDDGGFSLEQKNPDDLCSGALNWRASDFSTGGTPGFQNSIYTQTPLAPQLRILFPDSIHILLCFNKKTDPGSIQLQHFGAGGTDIWPVSMQILSPDTLLLTMNTTLQANKEYTLSFSGHINDCAGMPYINDTLIHIRRYEAAYGDILITEIMADPEPAVQLPAKEYIELYNTLPFAVSLHNWQLQCGNSLLTLGPFILKPGAYALLGPKQYNTASPVSLVPYSGSLSISNESARLSLINEQQMLIHQALYDINMFGEAVKKNGGWSQEMADRRKICSSYGNRIASRDPSGGTPGYVNSCDTLYPLHALPEAVYSGFSEPDTLLLYFSQPLHPAWLNGLTVQAEQQYIGIKTVQDPDNLQLLKLKAANWHTAGNTLRLDGIQGCESATKNSSVISIPKDAVEDLSHLVWNEILFDPLAGGTTYIEWINRGSEAIELKNVYACLSDTLHPFCHKGIQPLSQSLWLPPGEIIAFSSDPLLTAASYTCSEPAHILRVPRLYMPNLSGGTVGIFSSSLQKGELVSVNASLHLPFLASSDGVALERIRPQLPPGPGNWTSASANCGYGSPGKENSQYISSSETETLLQTNVRIFSPDSDGYDDLLGISCRLPRPGMVLSVYVCDELGRRVKTLSNNQAAGIEWQGQWDGSNEQGQKCGVGAYVLLMEAFGTDGAKAKARTVVVLASRL